MLQPRSVAEPAALLMHGSHTGALVPVVRQCGTSAKQPASVPMGDVSLQVTHMLVGAPEQTWPSPHEPALPAATGVFTHALLVQASVVHAMPSLHCAALVHCTH